MLWQNKVKSLYKATCDDFCTKICRYWTRIVIWRCIRCPVFWDSVYMQADRGEAGNRGTVWRRRRFAVDGVPRARQETDEEFADGNTASAWWLPWWQPGSCVDQHHARHPRGLYNDCVLRRLQTERNELNCSKMKQQNYYHFFSVQFSSLHLCCFEHPFKPCSRL